MAFSLSPKRTILFDLHPFTAAEFLVIGIRAAENLGWKIGHRSDSGFIAYTRFSWFTITEEIRVRIVGGEVTVKSESNANMLFDWGKNRKNLARFVQALSLWKSAYTIEELEMEYELVRPSLCPPEQEAQRPPVTTTKERIRRFRDIFLPAPGYFVTPILIDINLVVFLAMIACGVGIFAPGRDSLLAWGANFRPRTVDGEPWRLFTSFFVHAGLIHLVFNMYALLYIGLLLEPHLGRARFLCAYLVAGLAGSLASMWWHEQTVSVGASGAIFGLYGALLVLLFSRLIEESARKTLRYSIFLFIGYMLFGALRGTAGIDHAAHIGGLLAGAAAAYLFIPSLYRPDNRRLWQWSLIGTGALMVTITWLTYAEAPHPGIDIGPNTDVHFLDNADAQFLNQVPAAYRAQMKRVMWMESLALEVLRKPKDTDEQELLYGIKDRGLYYWNEILTLLDEMDRTTIDLSLRLHNQNLREYCRLRIQSYKLLYRSVAEHTRRYDPEINALSGRIRMKMTAIQSMEKKLEQTDSGRAR